MMFGSILLVLEAHDGFRSNAMLVFPGLLLISVMLLDRASYLTTASFVLLVVAGLGIAEKHGLTAAIPGVRTPTSYDSIFYVDLTLAVFAMIGTRIASDAQRNVFDLHGTIERASEANLELKATSEELRKSEQQLASIYNTVQDVIFHLAVESEGRFRFVSVNAAFLRITGLRREMVEGKTVDEVIPQPSLTMVLGKYRQAMDERTTVFWEETSDYPTGRLTGEVSVAPVFDKEGICTHLVGSVHDITERKRAEATLRESEERLRNAERLTHAGHWEWNIKTNQNTWSDGIFRMFGRPLDYTPTYDGFFQAIAPQDRERVEQWVSDCLAATSGRPIEFQIVRPDGELRTVTCICEVSVDEEGVPERMFGADQDITELRRAQQEDFARQKLESVGTLAGGIAHDFNNLLGGIVAQAQLALEKPATGSHPNEELQAISDSALRGSEIVRELMIYAGKETAVPGLADVSQIVKEMLALLKVSVSKHARLETDLGQNLPAVRANPAQLRQIVMNLITNASDAIGERDGVIRVATSTLKQGRDTSTQTAEQSEGGLHVQLVVSDTGRGIPQEIQARVFDPFFSTKSAGRGLGLAVVGGIVRSLGGAIHLQSEPGRGTTVQVLLPSAEASHENNGRTAVSHLSSPQRVATVFGCGR
jgi:PAS domain S-box-containing protein